MKEIVLHGKHGEGKFTQVDDDMFEYLNQWRWLADIGPRTVYAFRFIRINNRQKSIRMHRLVIDVPLGMMPDHIDGDGLNNQRSNLRICTPQQNHQNKRMHKNNTSGYKGVIWNKYKKKWRASIQVNGKIHSLGDFKTAERAAIAYDRAALRYHGEFAKINFEEYRERIKKIPKRFRFKGSVKDYFNSTLNTVLP